jgi:hypothetical protein
MDAITVEIVPELEQFSRSTLVQNNVRKLFCKKEFRTDDAQLMTAPEIQPHGLLLKSAVQFTTKVSGVFGLTFRMPATNRFPSGAAS